MWLSIQLKFSELRRWTRIGVGQTIKAWLVSVASPLNVWKRSKWHRCEIIIAGQQNFEDDRFFYSAHTMSHKGLDSDFPEDRRTIRSVHYLNMVWHRYFSGSAMWQNGTVPLIFIREHCLDPDGWLSGIVHWKYSGKHFDSKNLWRNWRGNRGFVNFEII